MFLGTLVAVLGLLVCPSLQSCCGDDDPFLNDTFPKDFMWSTATASYQIEGAWNIDGKGENIWDNFTHSCCPIEGNATGDVACDSYHKYKADVEALKFLGVEFYRFSISWSRVMPDGTNATINRKGIEYYKDVLQSLKAAKIKPMVTLYHWDLPQALQTKYGGWVNETLVGLFKEYARLCFKEFGDDVKWWITFNEPWVVTFLGYGAGQDAPGIKDPGYSPYNAAHTIIKAHAEAYHLYQEEFNQDKEGKISITLNADWYEPRTSGQEDKKAAERAEQFQLGWFAHPIYVNGDYPEIMKTQVQKKSTGTSRLPAFSEEEKKRINGTFDFFGLNHYTTQLISNNATGRNKPDYSLDQEVDSTRNYQNWPSSGSVWLYVVPWGLRNLLKWIRDEYGNPNVFITENGMSDRNRTFSGIMNDTHRIFYYKHYINNVLKAIKKDNCNVIGYTAWSLIDNFEWSRGYEEKFGLHFVNMSDPARPRVAKDSARYYKQIVKDNGFPEPRHASSSAFTLDCFWSVFSSGVLTTFIFHLMNKM